MFNDIKEKREKIKPESPLEIVKTKPYSPAPFSPSVKSINESIESSKELSKPSGVAEKRPYYLWEKPQMVHPILRISKDKPQINYLNVPTSQGVSGDQSEKQPGISVTGQNGPSAFDKESSKIIESAKAAGLKPVEPTENTSVVKRPTVYDIAPNMVPKWDKVPNYLDSDTEKEAEDTWLKKIEADSIEEKMLMVLASLADAGINSSKGILELGENGVDFLVSLLPYINYGQQMANGAYYNIDTQRNADSEFQAQKQATVDFIEKNFYDSKEVQNGIESIDKYSVFGEKTDKLLQSGGEHLAEAVLKAFGAPEWIVSGITSYGREVENALNNDATLDEAIASGLVSFGAEVLAGKISGEIKTAGNKIGDSIVKKFSSAVTQKTVKILGKMGVNMAAAGSEEILSGIMSAVGKKIIYSKEKDLKEIFSNEGEIESFISNAIMDYIATTGKHMPLLPNGGSKEEDRQATGEKSLFDSIKIDRYALSENSVTRNYDFARNSKYYGGSNDKIDDSNVIYHYINGDREAERYIKKIMNSNDIALLAEMTPQEIAIYNYYWITEVDKNQAMQYLKSIESQLIKRMGKE